MSVDDPAGEPATTVDQTAPARLAKPITVTAVVDDGRPGITPALAGDLRRGAIAGTCAAAAFAVSELVTTRLAAHGASGLSTWLRFALVDASLSFLVGLALVPLLAAAAVASRLTYAAFGWERARRWPGLFAPRPAPDRAVARLWAIGLAAVVYLALSAPLTMKIEARYREPDLAALLLAALQVVLIGAVALGGLLADRLLGRISRGIDRWLGRLNPIGYAPAALGLLALLVLPGLALVGVVLPSLRPLVPWREIEALFALAAGAEVGSYWVVPRGLLPRGRRNRLFAVAGALFVVFLVVPVTLIRIGADPRTKTLIAASSPPLTDLVDFVRKANDFDGDGYGSLFGENDCAPFDPSIHPLARDIPDDGIDQNCDGHDFVLGRLPSYRKGQKMAVPDAYRGTYNVLLITIDTVRYDHTTMGGYDKSRGRDTTPNLAKLAARGVSFAFCNAPSAGTMASVPAIITSKFFHSGIALDENVPHGAPPRLKPENVLISEIMKRKGYQTGAILTHDYFNDWGMEQGFDTYDNDIGRKHDPYAVTSDRLTDKALGWIGQHDGKPWFLWLHYVDPHGRYVNHPGDVSYGSSEEDIYDGELSFTDKHIGRLIDELDHMPAGGNTIVVVTSDHGDGFNEHGFINHGQALYFELLHVPLIVYVPNVEPRVVQGPVSNLDIIPTLTDILGIDVHDLSFEGESLVPQLFYGKDARDRIVFSETNWPKPLRAVVTDHYKLIDKLQDNLYELYDLDHDPREQKNLWPGQDGAAFTQLKGYLDDWLERVYYSRDPDKNQVMTKLKDVLLDTQPRPQHPVTGVSFDGGNLEVVGYDLDKEQYQASDKVAVAVYFHVVRRPSGDFLLQLEGRATGQTPPVLAMSQLRATAGGILPTSRWRDGEYIRDRFQLQASPRWAQPAGADLVLGLRLTDAQRHRLTPVGPTIAGDPELVELGRVALAPGTPPPAPGQGLQIAPLPGHPALGPAPHLGPVPHLGPAGPTPHGKPALPAPAR